MNDRERRQEMAADYLRRSAAERAALVADLLQVGEAFAVDPALCVTEQTEPPKVLDGVEDEGFLYATDRRLLWSSENRHTKGCWPYQVIAQHELAPCTYAAWFGGVKLFPILVRLKMRRRYFATLKIATDDGKRFAFHGSRPFLQAIEEVLAHVDVGALPASAPTAAVYVEGQAMLKCRDCGTGIADVVAYCAGCGRAIDWGESRAAAETFNAAQARKAEAG